jgi:hypothetical protein
VNQYTIGHCALVAAVAANIHAQAVMQNVLASVLRQEAGRIAL